MNGSSKPDADPRCLIGIARDLGLKLKSKANKGMTKTCVCVLHCEQRCRNCTPTRAVDDLYPHPLRVLHANPRLSVLPVHCRRHYRCHSSSVWPHNSWRSCPGVEGPTSHALPPCSFKFRRDGRDSNAGPGDRHGVDTRVPRVLRRHYSTHWHVNGSHEPGHRRPACLPRTIPGSARTAPVHEG